VVKEGLFKERLTALVAYMKAVDHASFSTIRKFVRDVMGKKVSRGYLRKVVEKASAALEAPYAELLKRLPLEQVLNVDETGHKDTGDKFWTWVFRAELYVLFKIDKTRGSKVLRDVPSRLDANGRELKREAFNMARRFRENGKAYFEFITTPGTCLCVPHADRSAPPTTSPSKPCASWSSIGASRKVRAASKDAKPANGSGPWSPACRDARGAGRAPAPCRAGRPSNSSSRL
jgi:hypothetical protein